MSSEADGATPHPADPLRELAEEWEEEARAFDRYNCDRMAAACRQHAEQLRELAGEFWSQELGIDKATAWTGYSAKRLRALVREGTIRDRRPEGSQARLSFRLGDLPRKPAGARPHPEGEDRAETEPEQDEDVGSWARDRTA